MRLRVSKLLPASFKLTAQAMQDAQECTLCEDGCSKFFCRKFELYHQNSGTPEFEERRHILYNLTNKINTSKHKCIKKTYAQIRRVLFTKCICFDFSFLVPSKNRNRSQLLNYVQFL